MLIVESRISLNFSSESLEYVVNVIYGSQVMASEFVPHLSLSGR